MHANPHSPPAPIAPAVGYSHAAVDDLLARDDVLAVLDFATDAAAATDPRALTVRLPPWPVAGQREVWRVDGPVRHGREGPVCWAEGGGWLYAAIDLADPDEDIQARARQAYGALTGFLGARPTYHVQRLWNYLDRINEGAGDEERYRRFCAGRLQGMGSYFDEGFPAATAVGHAGPAGQLQVYCLAARMPGIRIENPRQMSAWRYPRQYGPVSPSFARGMRLPGDDALAISGTAAINGHSSQHAGNLEAQLDETLTNLRSLLQAGSVSGTLDPRATLKAYVRHLEHMPAVDAFLARHLPDAPRILLQADICRRELLVEIDGWHFDRG